ncbi:hypothetical protein [Teichococcus aestuarii]|uniref:hypothetical protein n=1 Tax=Teichococcus aestuarii TaxID=568898 RepID=UPI003614E639
MLPLAVRRRHGLRVLEWAAKDVSDYCDALLAPSREDLILPLWRAARAQGGFDVAYLSHLRPGGVLVRFGQGRLRLWPGHRSTVASALRLGAWSSGAGFVEFLAPGSDRTTGDAAGSWRRAGRSASACCAGQSCGRRSRGCGR